MAKNREAVLGIDLGTGSVKCTLLDARGRQVASTTASYPTHYPKPGYAEQDPRRWYDAVVAAVRELINQTLEKPQVLGIGLTGAAHIPVLLDEHLEIIRPAILWTDQRSVKQVDHLNRTYAEDILKTTFNRASCTWTLPQLMWLNEHEPQSMSRLKHLTFGKDYVLYRLTGVLVTDETNAASTMLMDMRTKCWSSELTGFAKLNLQSLPRIVRPTDTVGTLSSEAAQDLGLKPGIPVIAGALDSVMELWSLGLTGEGDSMIRLGTAGGAMIISGTPHPNEATITYPYLYDQWCTQAFNNACATALQWITQILKPDASFDTLDAMASTISPGSDGLIFHPYLLGERAPYWDADLRASFTGATMQHKAEHFVRSVLEGTSYAIRDCLELLMHSGYRVGRLMLTGGGSKSPLWREILSDVLGAELIRSNSDGSVVGVAMLTGTAVGLFSDDHDAISKCVSTQGVVVPQLDRHDEYSRLYQYYKEIVSVLQPIYRRLAVNLKG